MVSEVFGQTATVRKVVNAKGELSALENTKNVQ
jgi:hypothetical protein